MDNNVYIALSRQIGVFRDMDVTANNLANAGTTGYSADRMLFSSFLSKDNNDGNRNKMALASPSATYRDTTAGSIRVTGNDLDVALQSSGYFTVQTPGGPRYTRSGNFQMDGGGTLVTQEGYPVLDVSGQPISLPENTKEVQIGQLGNIKVNGEDFATLGVVDFANPQLLERVSGGLYRSNVAPQAAQNISVLQGSLEGSNVQPMLEMTHMIDVARSVDSTAKYIEVVYDLMRKAANAYAQQS